MTRKLLTLVALVASCFCLTSCGGHVLVHDPNAAAATAEAFARSAFVSKDMGAAYAMMTPRVREGIPQQTFSDAIGKMHPNGFADEVSAVEYEPIPGQAGMNIYLIGRNSSETFYYRMSMAGDKLTGYQVSSAGREKGAFPPSKRRRPL